MATKRQLDVNRWHQRSCIANGHPPSTLKHRSLAGTETNQVAGGSTNTRLRARSGNQVLETTTDVKIWVVWNPIRVRGGVADGGDSPAGRQWTARWFGQCPVIDINNNSFTIFDDDWIVPPDGELFQVENPMISADGATWTFEGVQQR